jgi:hypothetical protein
MPMHTRKSQGSNRFARFKLISAGAVLAGVGLLWMERGIQVLRHWTGQPLFSWGLIATGLFCIVLALIPTSWIAKAAELPRAKGRVPR